MKMMNGSGAGGACGGDACAWQSTCAFSSGHPNLFVSRIHGEATAVSEYLIGDQFWRKSEENQRKMKRGDVMNSNQNRDPGLKSEKQI